MKKLASFGWLTAALITLASCGGAAPASTSASPSSAAPAQKTASSAAPASSSAAAKASASSAAASAKTGSSAAAGATEKMTVGYAAISVTQMPAWVAKEEGFFADNGLDVDLISIGGGSNPTGALISGQIQALQISVEAMEASLNGAGLVYVAAPQKTVLFSLFSIPSITNASQLKGKKVGVTGVGTATYTAAKMALKSLKLDPTKDVNLISVNNVPAILAAMQSGAVQGGALSMPTIAQARKAGMKELVDVAKLGIPFPSAWDVVSKQYLAQHPDNVRRFVKSIVQAIAFEIREPEKTQAILAKYTKTTDQQIVKETYDSSVPYLLKTPLPDIQAVKNGLDDLSSTLPQAKNADPASFIDDRFVKELDSSGYIASLYK